MLAVDWDAATVTVTIPVHHTATVTRQQIELTLKQFAGLLMTNAPSEWFAKPPVSDDLPLAAIDLGKA